MTELTGTLLESLRAEIGRPRRLRLTPPLRDLVRETQLSASDLILPFFVRHGSDLQSEIASMPGIFQWSIDRLVGEVEQVASLGVRAVILFGIQSQRIRLEWRTSLRMASSSAPSLLSKPRCRR